jgi:hypothetical protein
VAEGRPGGRGVPAERRFVDDVVDDEGGVVDELHADGELDGGVHVAVERFADQYRDGGTDALATGERDVANLLAKLGGFDGLDDGLQPIFDAAASVLEVLH